GDYQSRGDYRTNLGVPLMRDGQVIGVFTLARLVMRPFTDRQIELVRTFADQAVIPIENAALVDEGQGRTRAPAGTVREPTATDGVLGIISGSAGDLAPVFHAMLAQATRICEAKFGVLWEYEDGQYRAVSWEDVPEAFVDFAREPRVWGPDTGLGRVAKAKEP